MSSLIRVGTAVLLLLVFCLPLGCPSGGGRQPAEGSPAPDFALEDLSGKPLRLSDLRGKVVLLNFWGTWCPPCRDEAPSLARLNAAMAEKNFMMIAVALDRDGKQAVEAFFNKSGTRLPAFLDPSGRVARQYGVTGVPETFIIDKQGVIRKKLIGPEEWDSPDVIAFLDKLL